MDRVVLAGAHGDLDQVEVDRAAARPGFVDLDDRPRCRWEVPIDELAIEELVVRVGRGDPVEPRAAIHAITATVPGRELVIAAACDQVVHPSAAHERVVAQAADETIGATEAENAIVAPAAVDDVAAAGTAQDVVAASTPGGAAALSEPEINVASGTAIAATTTNIAPIRIARFRRSRPRPESR